MMDDVTVDDFLSGAIKVAQPKSGYRAGIDPILLAASIPAKSGQTVLELGCGVGTASLALAHRVTDLNITAVEVQERYAELARHNADLNKLPLSLVCADLAALRNAVLSSSEVNSTSRSSSAHAAFTVKGFLDGIDLKNVGGDFRSAFSRHSIRSTNTPVTSSNLLA